MHRPHWHWILAAFVGAACQGVIGEVPGSAETGASDSRPGASAGGHDGATGGIEGTSASPGASAGGVGGKIDGPDAVGESPLRRLGKGELRNTLQDLFPDLEDGFDADVELPNDNDIALAFSLPGTVSDLEVKRFMELAEKVIASLGDGAPNRKIACANQDETACAHDFVKAFGKRAFRRPLDDAEISDAMVLYSKLRTDPDMKYAFQEALGVVAEAMLQAPGFLYRWERGLAAPQMDGEFVRFDAYEVASRLSYFLWNSMPDAALLAAADAGKLDTPDEIAEAAARLLDDPRADATLADFVSQWLELGPLPQAIKDGSFYPTFQPSLLASLHDETAAFAKHVLRESPTFETLLTAPFTYVDAPLARYYGVSRDADGRVDLRGTPRLGVLTQGSLMAVKGNSYRTSPVRRGKFVLNRMLCITVPPPPPDVIPELPPPDPSKTLREQMAEHRVKDSCATCHSKMDPLGFAFEHFDGAGNYRADDNGHVIDASGTVKLDGAEVPFADAAELARELAASPQAHECFARQWLRYAIDRFEQTEDAVSVQKLASSFEESGQDAQKLIVEITRSMPFTHRALAEGEDTSP